MCVVCSVCVHVCVCMCVCAHVHYVDLQCVPDSLGQIKMS